MALNKATKERRFVEAVAVQTLMLKDYNLNQISSKTIYDIVLSLIKLEMNEVAKELFSKKYKPQIVKPKKGKGSFVRKKKW